MKNHILIAALVISIPADFVQAERGAFNEHDINIPGYGRWDD